VHTFSTESLNHTIVLVVWNIVTRLGSHGNSTVPVPFRYLVRVIRVAYVRNLLYVLLKREASQEGVKEEDK
jgi:hypothetical protein